MPPTNYDFICFYINHHSIQRTIKAEDKRRQDLNTAARHTAALLRKGHKVSGKDNKYKTSILTKQPEGLRNMKCDDTEREARAPEPHRAPPQDDMSTDTASDDHVVPQKDTQSTDELVPTYGVSFGSMDRDKPSLDYQRMLMNSIPKNIKMQDEVLRYYNQLTQYQGLGYKKLEDPD